MADINLIKTLRQETGLGIHDIKTALEEADGNQEKALEILKARGLAVAAKKSVRATSQGLIETYVHGGRIGALVEVSCETDFVARNAEFQAFVKDLAMQIASMNPENIDELTAQDYFRDPSVTVGQLLTDKISKIGENIKISRFVRFELGE